MFWKILVERFFFGEDKFACCISQENTVKVNDYMCIIMNFIFELCAEKDVKICLNNHHS